MQIHSYYNTANLGDAVQTVALRRLLGDVSYTDRDTPSEGSIVINGWLGDDWRSGDSSSIYAGIHIGTKKAMERMQQIHPLDVVGARDPYTHSLLSQEGIPSEFVGCATMTLPRYEGERKGQYIVDFDGAALKGRRLLTHTIPARMSWKEQLLSAEMALDLYRRAEAVITSRLHVALPCLAFGTKVYLMPKENNRFTIFDAMGLRTGWMTADLTEWSDRFKNFLTKRLKACNIK